MIDKKTQGKRNRQAGARFELKVRSDLEEKGWIVDKWSNQVEIPDHVMIGEDMTLEEVQEAYFRNTKLVPAKRKWAGPGRPMMFGSGFPDFICFNFIHSHIYKRIDPRNNEDIKTYEVIGVECKTNGYLDKKEKEKCKWLLENNIFSKILIASKGEKRGTINYKEFSKK